MRTFRIHEHDRTIDLTGQEWDAICDAIESHRITCVRAHGHMTDEGLARLAELEGITSLDLSGSVALTDAGLVHLANLPGLRALDLMGTQTGNAGIAALADKPELRSLRTGRQVTDAGLAMLDRIPHFRQWRGEELRYGLMGFDAGPTHLLIDGPFTDEGVASVARLDGLFGLSFFWHCTAITREALRPLSAMTNLGFLGFGGTLCDDEAMHMIAGMPRLRMLQAQGTVASDAGFVALSTSQTIEYIWGRECPNLSGRGFTALSEMPRLRGLAVSCKNVSDSALALLPRFPSLREFLSMDVEDDGFRHIARCHQLEALWCMYCRNTSDTATEHIAGLPRLKSYYAGATQITDRSIEILGNMTSLERVEFRQCVGITNAGVAKLARPGLQVLRS